MGKGVEDMSELVTTGVIEAICPEGWLNSPVYDIFAEKPNVLNPNQICFLKEAKQPDEYFSCPAVRINYHGENNTLLDCSGMYTDVERVAFERNGVRWVGFLGYYGTYQNGILQIEGKDNMSLSLCLTNERCSFTIEDEDFLSILDSIRITPVLQET